MAFYASVEERDDPGLKGEIPWWWAGARRDRGVVAAANYTAREFGIHSAMPMARAVRLCRHLVIVPPRGAGLSGGFRPDSRHLPPVHTPDRAALAGRGIPRYPPRPCACSGMPREIGRRIKEDIRNDLGLVASVGGAPNKFLAKLASDQGKPDGFLFIHAGQVQEFPRPAAGWRASGGWGKSARRRLHAAGVRTIGDLRRTSEKTGSKPCSANPGPDCGSSAMASTKGRWSRTSEATSISHETTFSRDITELDALEPIVLSLTEGVCYRLRRAGMGARTVNLKVRFHDFSTVTRAHSLPRNVPTRPWPFWQELRRLLRTLLADRRFAVRLVGVGREQFQRQRLAGGRIPGGSVRSR